MIFDTHAHYDADAFDADRDEVMESLQKNRICAVNVGADIQGARDSVSLASRCPFLFAAAGIHPDDVGVLEHEAPLSGDEQLLAQLFIALQQRDSRAATRRKQRGHHAGRAASDNDYRFAIHQYSPVGSSEVLAR